MIDNEITEIKNDIKNILNILRSDGDNIGFCERVRICEDKLNTLSSKPSKSLNKAVSWAVIMNFLFTAILIIDRVFL